MTDKVIRIGTRGSELALLQTNMVKSALEERNPGLQCEVVEIKTQGDKKQGTPRARQSDKRDWVLELEEALAGNSIDLAVHSSKDVPADYHEDTALSSVLKRAPAADAFIGKSVSCYELRFAMVPQGAKVGTSSLRRKAELLRLRPDLEVVEHRGNVPTRIRKLKESEDLMGIVLARAGLERLGYGSAVTTEFIPLEMMPAVNQGILSVQYASANDAAREYVGSIVDPLTRSAWEAERACVEVLEADCNSALGIFAQVREESIELSCRILSHDGTQVVEKSNTAPLGDEKRLGHAVAEFVLNNGGRELL